MYIGAFRGVLMMENIDPAVLNAEIDIDLYATYIYTPPLFWVLLVGGIITIIMLWKRHKLKGMLIPLAVVNVFSSLIGSLYYDGFIKDIYRGGYEFDFSTVSGVCFTISAISLVFLIGYFVMKVRK